MQQPQRQHRTVRPRRTSGVPTAVSSLSTPQAQQAGAKAIVVYNDGAADARPIVMGGLDAAVTIPGVMITQADGVGNRRCQRTSTRRSTWRLDPADDDQIADVLLARPRPRRLDVQAGSVRAGRLDRLCRRRHGHGQPNLQGTSMASPHTAGAAALLRQTHPKLEPGGDQGAAAELHGRFERLRRYRPDATGCRCAARRSRRGV